MEHSLNIIPHGIDVRINMRLGHGKCNSGLLGNAAQYGATLTSKTFLLGTK